MSFYTSLSGLKGAQTDLSTISNNVANVGTLGFKKSKTEFGDLISSAPLQASGSIAGQGTRLKAITQQFTQGAFESSDKALDLAIAGQGFFMTRNGTSGGQVSFTRNGAFNVDADRYITDSTGGYLQVLPVDQDGNVTAAGLTAARAVQLPLTSGSPKATSKVDLSVTLPSTADVPENRALFGADNEYKFNRQDANTYNSSTGTTVYDKDGKALPATLYYTRKTLATGTPATSTWEARLFVGNQEVTSDATAATQPAPLTMTFDASGALVTPDGAVSYGDTNSPVTFDVKYGATTKMVAQPFALTALTQDGFAAGSLDNITVGKDGLVSASFSNGSTQALGKVVMANFANPAGLRQLGDARWSVTGNSGEPIIGEATTDGFGAIQSGSLERANVDITDELVALISAQRNFQANAKAIETANTLTQTIVNLRS